MSELQLDLSHPLPRTRIDVLILANPIPDPCKVRLRDPVAPPFVRIATLITTLSLDKALDKLPTRNPPLIRTRTLPPIIRPRRQSIELSDLHVVASHALGLADARTLTSPSPKPLPCSVAATDPVAARFVVKITLATRTSTLRPRLKLMEDTPTEDTMRRLLA